MSHLGSAQSLVDQRKGLLRLARHLVRNEADAEDVVQDSFVAALEADGIRRPGAWLRGTARRIAGKHYRSGNRRRAREQAAARPERVAATDHVAAGVEIQRSVLAALEALPPAYRTALWMRYFQGLPPRRIAADQGIPVATVKTRLNRGLERLRGELDRRHGGERRRWLAALCLHVGPLRASAPSLAPIAIAVALLLGIAVTIGLVGMTSKATGDAEHIRSTNGDDGPTLAGRSSAPPAPILGTPEGESPPAAVPITSTLTVRLAHRSARDFEEANLILETEDGTRQTALLSRARPASFPHVPRGRHRLRVETGPTFVASEPFVDARLPGPLEVEIAVMRARPLVGRVRDALTHAPISGARVRLVQTSRHGTESAGSWAAVSDAGGRFRIARAPYGPRVALVAEAAGYAVGHQMADVRSRTGPEPVIDLEPGGSVAGRVLMPDGSPAVDAWVWAAPPASNGDASLAVRPEDGSLRSGVAPGDVVTLYEISPLRRRGPGQGRGAWIRAARTDAKGAYRLTGLAYETRYQLSATAPRTASPLATPIVLTDEAPSLRRNLQLRGAGRIRLRVLDAEGRPLSQGAVRLGTSEWEPLIGSLFESLLLPVGKRRIAVTASSGVWIGEVSVAGREAKPQTIRLAAGQRVDGVVLDELGIPVPGAWIGAAVDGLTVAGAMTTEAGGFVLERIPAGALVLTATRKGGTELGRLGPTTTRGETLRLRVRYEERAQPTSCIVTLDVPGSWVPPRIVRVRSAAPFGGVSGAIDTLRARLEGTSGRSTGRDWRIVQVQNLQARIAWDTPGGGALLLHAPGFVPVRLSPEDLDRGAIDVTLESARTARGVVVDEAGAPLPGVHFAASLDVFANVALGVTDAGGAFEIGGLPAGGAEVVFLAPGRPHSVAHVQIGPDVSNRIEMAPGARLVIRVRSESGSPVEGRRVELRMREQAAPFRVLDLVHQSGQTVLVPAGALWVNLDGQAPQRVQLDRNEVRTLRLVTQP